MMICGKELKRNKSTSRLESANGVGLSTDYENRSAILPACTAVEPTGKREIKVVPETAGEEL